MTKKIGICLGSGGARGIAHIGFLQALEDNNVPIDAISGCSMGSLVGAMYLLGHSPEKMREMAIKLKKNDLIDLNISLFKSKSILRGHKLDSILNDFFGEKTFEHLSKPFACIATDLISGNIHTFTEGSLKLAVRASCSIPIAFSPVAFEDKLLCDGGISNRTPVDAVRNLGVDTVIAVDVLAQIPEASKMKNIFALGFRALDIMGVNISRSDTNQRPDLLLIPKLGNASQYKVENQQFCYDKGYEIAIENMDRIKAVISS